MRITCPNCASHFKIPTELLGKKGRALKCASCGHSWYQSAQVDNLDLASIMGEEYAEKAQAAAGSPRIRNEMSSQAQVAANRAAAAAPQQGRAQAAPQMPSRWRRSTPCPLNSNG